VYPHLRVMSLKLPTTPSSSMVVLSQPQLQLLCSCCPAVESLVLGLRPDVPPSALESLKQLSALTHLHIALPDDGLSAAAVVGSAAQLTGLKHLVLSDLSDLTGPAVLQLTALTALQELQLDTRVKRTIFFNQVSSSQF
jgi:hypothetical protein